MLCSPVLRPLFYGPTESFEFSFDVSDLVPLSGTRSPLFYEVTLRHYNNLTPHMVSHEAVSRVFWPTSDSASALRLKGGSVTLVTQTRIGLSLVRHLGGKIGDHD